MSLSRDDRPCPELRRARISIPWSSREAILGIDHGLIVPAFGDVAILGAGELSIYNGTNKGNRPRGLFSCPSPRRSRAAERSRRRGVLHSGGGPPSRPPLMRLWLIKEGLLPRNNTFLRRKVKFLPRNVSLRESSAVRRGVEGSWRFGRCLD